MAVPKKKTSSSKTKKRRSHDFLRTSSGHVIYPDCCDRPLLPHRTCEKGFECDAYAKKGRR
jgi:ribosomal protein L32